MNFYQSLGYLVFGSRLKRLGDSFLNDINSIYKKHRIPFDASWFPVFYVLSCKHEISIKEISDDINTSHSAVSQLLSGLQQKGLVKSVVSKKDARHKVVTFTAKGQRLLQKIQPVWEALQKAMDELANENIESKKILDALTGMEKNIERSPVYERVEKFLK